MIRSLWTPPLPWHACRSIRCSESCLRNALCTSVGSRVATAGVLALGQNAVGKTFGLCVLAVLRGCAAAPREASFYYGLAEDIDASPVFVRARLRVLLFSPTRELAMYTCCTLFSIAERLGVREVPMIMYGDKNGSNAKKYLYFMNPAIAVTSVVRFEKLFRSESMQNFVRGDFGVELLLFDEFDSLFTRQYVRALENLAAFFSVSAAAPQVVSVSATLLHNSVRDFERLCATLGYEAKDVKILDFREGCEGRSCEVNNAFLLHMQFRSEVVKAVCAVALEQLDLAASSFDAPAIWLDFAQLCGGLAALHCVSEVLALSRALRSALLSRKELDLWPDLRLKAQFVLLFLGLQRLTQRRSRCFVFCNDFPSSRLLYAMVAGMGLRVIHTSGKASSAQRFSHYLEFVSATDAVLVTSDVLARGFHDANSCCALHVELPYSFQDFTHRLARARENHIFLLRKRDELPRLRQFAAQYGCDVRICCCATKQKT